MASSSTGADLVVDKTTPLDRLVKSVLPGVGSQLDDVRNEFTLLTTTSLSPLLATGKQTEDLFQKDLLLLTGVLS